MKQPCIGIIGGMSWESTAFYYQLINQGVKEILGGLHSANILLKSLDFAPVSEWQHHNNWQAISDHLIAAAKQLEAGGADAIAIATNTMHKLAPEIQAAVSIPVIHIADATASECQALSLDKVGLLGTRFTMEEPFYRDRLRAHGIDVLVPDVAARQSTHDIIYKELCRGDVRPSSREVYQQVIEQMAIEGAKGVVLGCTEIGMLIGASDVSIPVLDTTQVHCREIVRFLMGE